MRYLDRTGCGAFGKAKIDKDIKSKGSLTRTATKKAELNGLALLKTSWGKYKIIRACGLGAYQDEFETLEQVNAFLLNIDQNDDKMSKTWLGY